MLYDLTNTYFEGAKRTSNLARYGRSKEKRSDARLVVLATVCRQNGDATMAHWHLGLLAYWLVNTIRHQLKASVYKKRLARNKKKSQYPKNGTYHRTEQLQ